MTSEQIEAILDRLNELPRDDRESALWRMLGGMQYEATHRPQTRLGEAFRILERHVQLFEKVRAQGPAPAVV